MLEIQQEHTLIAAIADGLNLFVGAGFSLLSRNDAGRPMPIGDELRDELVAEFALENASGLTLAQVCAVIESTQRERLHRYFTIQYQDIRPAVPCPRKRQSKDHLYDERGRSGLQDLRQ
jgi:hypothetical protein